MSLSVKIVRKNQYKISSWSGGITTELYIYPEDSEYSSRNFKWRLSSAKVEKEESVFTALPGFKRLIMILQGELYLNHEGHHSTVMKEFEQDSFSGDWKTKSRGRVTDFNLMMAKGCQGKLEAVSIKRRTYKEVIRTDNLCNDKFENHTEAFYIAQGSVDITAGNERVNLSEGDLVLINVMNQDVKPEVKLYNRQDTKAMVIRASISY